MREDEILDKSGKRTEQRAKKMRTNENARCCVRRQGGVVPHYWRFGLLKSPRVIRRHGDILVDGKVVHTERTWKAIWCTVKRSEKQWQRACGCFLDFLQNLCKSINTEPFTGDNLRNNTLASCSNAMKCRGGARTWKRRERGNDVKPIAQRIGTETGFQSI